MKSTYLGRPCRSLPAACRRRRRGAGSTTSHIPDTQGTLFSRAVEAFDFGFPRYHARSSRAWYCQGPEEWRGRDPSAPRRAPCTMVLYLEDGPRSHYSPTLYDEFGVVTEIFVFWSMIGSRNGSVVPVSRRTEHTSTEQRRGDVPESGVRRLENAKGSTLHRVLVGHRQFVTGSLSKSLRSRSRRTRLISTHSKQQGSAPHHSEQVRRLAQIDHAAYHPPSAVGLVSFR